MYFDMLMGTKIAIYPFWLLEFGEMESPDLRREGSTGAWMLSSSHSEQC